MSSNISTVFWDSSGKLSVVRFYSLQGTNNTFSVQYATGTVFGTVVRDTMQIGNTVLTNQSFGAASVANTAFLMSSCDGIFVSPFPSQCNQPPSPIVTAELALRSEIGLPATFSACNYPINQYTSFRKRSLN